LLQRSIQVFLAISVIVALYGLYQFVAFPLGLPGVDLFGYSASFRQTRLYAISLAGGRFLRIWSTLSEPVWFGDFLVAAIPLLASYVLSRQSVLTLGRHRLLQGRWQVLLLLPLMVALLLTFARSAWFALVIALATLVLILFRPKELLRWLVIALVLIVVLVSADAAMSRLPISQGASLLDAVISRFVSPFGQEDFGNIHRYTALQGSLAMFKDYPWLGVGYGNFGFHFDLYKPIGGRALSDTLGVFPVMSGGMFFRLLAETGVIGTMAFVVLLVLIAWTAYQAWRSHRNDPFLAATSAGLLASFVGLVARLTLADSIHFTYTWFIVGLIVVLRGRADRLQRGDEGAEVA